MSDTERMDRPPPRDGAVAAAGRATKEGAPSDDLGFDLPPPASVTPLRGVAIGAVILLLAGGVFAVTYLPKRHAEKELATETKASGEASPKVQVVTPKVKSSDRSISLPGNVQALQETTIHPRSNGYVRKWHVDIGDKVEENALLVEIDQPEIDQQLEQARAQLTQVKAGLAQATANRDYSAETLSRYEKLAPRGVTSQQELDQYRSKAKVDEANLQVAKAAIDGQEANVRRLLQMKSWGRVTAPFAGRISSRTTEIGDLVSPTSSLFKLAAAETVRVFVQVPQDVAPSVRADVPAQVVVREFPNRNFEGKVARSAGALDLVSRTMNTEVRVPNPKGELLPGMYAQVALTLPVPHRVFEIPSTAVITDAKGLRVATVDAESKIKLVPITIERDTGPTIEIATGIDETSRVVKLVSAELVDGRQVEVAR